MTECDISELIKWVESIYDDCRCVDTSARLETLIEWLSHGDNRVNY